MFTLANIPFVGLCLLIIGLIGFVTMGIILGNHTGLFAVIVGWYGVTISGVALALRNR